MTTPRRSILSALALAPLVGAVSVAPAMALPVDAGRSEADWLEHGSRNADPAFAALCAEALRHEARSRAAWTLYQDAEEASCADHMVRELARQCDEATDAVGDALTAVLDYQPRNAAALMVKLHLLGCRYGVDNDSDASVDLPAGRFSALIADVARALAS